MVERSLSMREVPGSIPGSSMETSCLQAGFCHSLQAECLWTLNLAIRVQVSVEPIKSLFLAIIAAFVYI